jgi:hypothetical protein
MWNSLVLSSRCNIFKSLAHVQAEKIKVEYIEPEMGSKEL